MAHSIIETCIGCGTCLRACPVGAITGERKSLHVIDPGLCIDCGTCGRVCPAGAVLDSDGLQVARLKKSLWLKPSISVEACYACENCVNVCPTGALSMADDHQPLQKNYAVLSSPERCVSCGWCVQNCVFDAIVMEGPHAGD